MNTPENEPGMDALDEFGLTANDGRHYTLPESPVWREGPPPCIGWWPASAERDKCLTDLRWWNGQYWSLYAEPWDDEAEAEDAKSHKHAVPPRQRILWADRWWMGQ